MERQPGRGSGYLAFSFVDLRKQVTRNRPHLHPNCPRPRPLLLNPVHSSTPITPSAVSWKGHYVSGRLRRILLSVIQNWSFENVCKSSRIAHPRQLILRHAANKTQKKRTKVSNLCDVSAAPQILPLFLFAQIFQASNPQNSWLHLAPMSLTCHPMEPGDSSTVHLRSSRKGSLSYLHIASYILFATFESGGVRHF